MPEASRVSRMTIISTGQWRVERPPFVALYVHGPPQ